MTREALDTLLMLRPNARLDVRYKRFKFSLAYYENDDTLGFIATGDTLNEARENAEAHAELFIQKLTRGK